MAKVCYFTGRKTVSGNNRSHAMNQTKRAVKPNLQKVTVLILSLIHISEPTRP